MVLERLVWRLAVVALLATTATQPLANAESGRLTLAQASGRVAISADLIVLDGIAAERLNPVRAARLLAYASVAMERAAHHHTAPELAVTTAVAGILDGLLAAQAGPAHGLVATIRTELTDNGVSPRQLAAAERRGTRIAGRLLARAAHDGADTNQPLPAPQFQGAWQPTPPDFLPALEPAAGNWRTWNIASGDAYRPRPPLRPSDAGYDAQVAEVYAVAKSLTPNQTAMASFWADGPGSITPAGHWNLIAVELLRERRATLTEATRVLSTLNTAQADAFIACWDAKYTYFSERPVTAIRRDLDAGFLPLLTTPPFPSYVSGHSTTSAAAASVLAAFFPAAGAQLRMWAAEAAVSRLYAGIHFRMDNEAGLRLGRLVGTATLARIAELPPDRVAAAPGSRAGDSASAPERRWVGVADQSEPVGGKPNYADRGHSGSIPSRSAVVGKVRSVRGPVGASSTRERGEKSEGVVNGAPSSRQVPRIRTTSTAEAIHSRSQRVPRRVTSRTVPCGLPSARHRPLDAAGCLTQASSDEKGRV